MAFAPAEKACRDVGASERLKIMVAPATGHKVADEQREAVLEWFDKWLLEGPYVRMGQGY